MAGDPEPVRIGLVGINDRVCRVIIPGLRAAPHARLVAVCSRSAEKAAATAAELPGVRPFSDYAAMLREADIDAVFLCMPPQARYHYVMEAIAAGKHIIAEKPLSTDINEARRMVQAARRAGIRTAVNFTYRSVTGFRLVERLLQQGQVGRLLHLDFAYFQTKDLLPGASPKSAVQELGPHALETILWWGGLAHAGPVEAVLARHIGVAHAGLPAEAAQCAWQGLLRFRSGAMAAVQLSRIATGYRNGFRATLFGDRGAIAMEVEVDQSRVWAARAGEGRPEGEFRPVPIPEELVLPYDRFPAFHMERLAAAVAGAAPFPGFAEALRAEELMDAMIRSDQAGAWVPVAAEADA